MGLFKLFTGKSPADHERQGDALAQNQNWGEAKLAYESALEKSADQLPPDPDRQRRLQEKLAHSKETLAAGHLREAEAWMEAGCMDDARELLTVAMDLTEDEALRTELADRLEQTSQTDVPEIHYHAAHPDDGLDAPPCDPADEDADDRFDILLGTLPQAVRQAYRSYGYHFKHGYLALNQGDFVQAAEHLTQAAEANPEPYSLVPLELATAYFNLGRIDDAQALLEELVGHLPDLLPAIELLCDIYWNQEAFDQAMDLLSGLSPEVAESMGAFLLKGETLLQASRTREAQSFFQGLLDTYGWHEPVAMGLARAHEALDQIPPAREIYAQMISQCSGCGSRVDPAIKRKYADLSMAAGDLSDKTLEYYLSLSQEDPVNAPHYCQNISRIYAALGNEAEARRFQSIAQHLAAEMQALPDDA